MGTALSIELVNVKREPKNSASVILLERACEMSEEEERYTLGEPQKGRTYLRDSVTKIRVNPSENCGSCEIHTNGHFPTAEEVHEIVCRNAMVFGANACEYAPVYAGVAGEIFVDFAPLYRLSNEDVYRIMAARKHWEGQQSLDFG